MEKAGISSNANSNRIDFKGLPLRKLVRACPFAAEQLDTRGRLATDSHVINLVREHVDGRTGVIIPLFAHYLQVLPEPPDAASIYGFLFYGHGYIKIRRISTIHKEEVMKMRLVLPAALLVLTVGSSAYADYLAGVKALQSGDYPKAYSDFKASADQGDSLSQNALGVMNDIGQGIPQNYSEAFRWYSLAAAQGGADAQYNLGVMYAIAKGVPLDNAEAIKWFRKAAEQGQAKAQNTLGTIFAKGQGVPQDNAEAFKWYSKAADQGFPPAQENLGWMYASGQGTQLDLVRAHMWFNLAASRGIETAQKGRDAAAAKMTPAQLTEAQRLATEWMINRTK